MRERDGLELLIVLQLIPIPSDWCILRPVHLLMIAVKLLPRSEHLLSARKVLDLLTLPREPTLPMPPTNRRDIQALVQIVQLRYPLLDVIGVVADIMQGRQCKVLPLLQPVHLIIIDFIRSRTVVWQSYVAGRDVAVEAHPLSHCFDRAEVPVNAGVHALLPAAVLDAGVATDVTAMGLAVGHALAALLPAFWGGATGAVGVTIWEAVSSDGFHEGVGGEEQLDLPVGVSSGEHLDVEVAMSVHVLLLDQH